MIQVIWFWILEEFCWHLGCCQQATCNVFKSRWSLNSSWIPIGIADGGAIECFSMSDMRIIGFWILERILPTSQLATFLVGKNRWSLNSSWTPIGIADDCAFDKQKIWSESLLTQHQQLSHFFLFSSQVGRCWNWLERYWTLHLVILDYH